MGLSEMSGETAQPRDNDSHVRDHLANERTFLAWVRTAIAVMGFGVFIARLRWIFPAAPIHHGTLSATALGLWLSGAGLAMIPFALWNYFAIRRAVNDNKYESSGTSAVLFAVAIAIAGIGIIIYLISSSSGVAPASNLP